MSKKLIAVAQSLEQKWNLGRDVPSVSDEIAIAPADDGNNYMKQCSEFPNKKRYNTKKDAETVILINNQYGLRAYHCDTCNGWHLTSN